MDTTSGSDGHSSRERRTQLKGATDTVTKGATDIVTKGATNAALIQLLNEEQKAIVTAYGQMIQEEKS